MDGLFQAVLQVESGKDGKSQFQQLVKTEPLYARIREGLDSADKFEFASLPPGKFTALKEAARDKGKSLQGGLRRLGSAENYRVAPYPNVQDLEEKATVLTVDPSSGSVLAPVDTEVTEADPGVQPLEPSAPSSMVNQDELMITSVSAGQEATDPEVKWALEVLEKMIAYVKEHGPDALPFLQPQDKESDFERSKEVSNLEGDSSEPQQLLSPDCTQVHTTSKKVEDGVVRDISVLQIRTFPEKPVFKNASQAPRSGSARKGAAARQGSQRWSVFSCLPTSRLTKKQPLRIGKSPAPGSGSTVAGENVVKIGGRNPERNHVPPSHATDDVSLGELFSRETQI